MASAPVAGKVEARPAPFVELLSGERLLRGVSPVLYSGWSVVHFFCLARWFPPPGLVFLWAGHGSPPLLGGLHGLFACGCESASVEPGLCLLRVVRGAGPGSLPHTVVGRAIASVAPVPEGLWPPAQEGRGFGVSPVAFSSGMGSSFDGGVQDPPRFLCYSLTLHVDTSKL